MWSYSGSSLGMLEGPPERPGEGQAVSTLAMAGQVARVPFRLSTARA
jgi:hypothetical protein